MGITQEFQVGVIASPHGLKGEVNVFPTTETKERFKDLDTVMMDTERGSVLTLTIEGVKFTKKFVILKFKEFHRIEDVERLRGKKLMIRRDQAIPLKEGEYYVPDLIGLKVYDVETNGLFGTLIRSSKRVPTMSMRWNAPTARERRIFQRLMNA